MAAPSPRPPTSAQPRTPPQQQTPRPAPAQPGLSWADADALKQKLLLLDTRHRNRKIVAGEKVQVSETELNSYINLSMASQLPPGVTGIEVHFDSERIAAKALVDLERVQGQVPVSSSPWNPFSLLSGRVPVELKGKLTNADGFGTFAFEDIRVGALPLPASVLAQAVSSATKTRENPQGFDILSPFRLPYSVRRVRLQPGRAVLEF
jgi:hypothetical protein